MAEAKKTTPAKQPYEKPTLARVELAIAEVMAVGCKLDGGGNGVRPPTCLVGGCSMVPGS